MTRHFLYWFSAYSGDDTPILFKHGYIGVPLELRYTSNSYVGNHRDFFGSLFRPKLKVYIR